MRQNIFAACCMLRTCALCAKDSVPATGSCSANQPAFCARKILCRQPAAALRTNLHSVREGFPGVCFLEHKSAAAAAAALLSYDLLSHCGATDSRAARRRVLLCLLCLCVLALLIGNTAGRLACGLAGSLALAAAAILCAGAQVSGFHRRDHLHSELLCVNQMIYEQKANFLIFYPKHRNCQGQPNPMSRDSRITAGSGMLRKYTPNPMLRAKAATERRTLFPL